MVPTGEFVRPFDGHDVARLLDHTQRLGVAPGTELLDVCTGAGLTAIPAARAGAGVTGLDLVPELLEVAKQRAAAEGVAIRWVEGDAEKIALPDASFDVVTSTFGVQFTPCHEASSAEVARVLRPGGVVGLVNWTPRGFIGQVFGTLAPYLPPLPEGATPTGRWGLEEHIQSLFADHAVSFAFEYGYAHFRGPSAEEWVDFMADRYGPMHMARKALEPERWAKLRGELVDVATKFNASEGQGLDVPSEYLIAIGRKAGGS